MLEKQEARAASLREYPGSLTYERLERHITEILDFWEPAVDYENGGIFYSYDPRFDPPLRRTGEKCLLMHVRQLYNFSVGAKLGVAGAEKVARFLYDTLDEVFESFDGIYDVGHVPRFARSGSKTLQSYSQFYAVLGLARYASITGERSAYQKARTLFRTARTRFEDPPFRENGLFRDVDLDSGQPRGAKSGNAMLHQLEALINLRMAAQTLLEGGELATEIDLYDGILEDTYHLFTNKLFDSELLITPELFTAELAVNTRWERSVTMAHPLEWLGFWYEMELLGYNRFPFVREQGIRLVEKTVERAVTPSGCFENRFFLQERMCAETADFWAQPEAILNILYARRAFRDDRYLEVARRLADFYFQYFVDMEGGGVFSEVSSRGIVIGRRKGTRFKCDHHSLRMCEKAIEYSLLD